MATYKGQDIAASDQDAANLKLRGGRAPGMENIEEELNLPAETGTERTRRPGEKGYRKEMHMADEKNLKREYGGEAPPSPLKREYGGAAPPSPLKREYGGAAPPASMKGTQSYNKGGIVGPNVTKWGSPKVTAPCKDSKTIKCY